MYLHSELIKSTIHINSNKNIIIKVFKNQCFI